MSAKFLEVPLKEPSYLTLTPYERNFPLTYWRHVFGDYWQISAYASVVYVVLLFGGRWWMSHRQPFKLNQLLTVWNIGLATMSIYAFLRVAPEFFVVLLGKNGFHNSVCEWWAHWKKLKKIPPREEKKILVVENIFEKKSCTIPLHILFGFFSHKRAAVLVAKKIVPVELLQHVNLITSCVCSVHTQACIVQICRITIFFYHFSFSTFQHTFDTNTLYPCIFFDDKHKWKQGRV